MSKSPRNRIFRMSKSPRNCITRYAAQTLCITCITCITHYALHNATKVVMHVRQYTGRGNIQLKFGALHITINTAINSIEVLVQLHQTIRHLAPNYENTDYTKFCQTDCFFLTNWGVPVGVCTGLPRISGFRQSTQRVEKRRFPEFQPRRIPGSSVF